MASETSRPAPTAIGNGSREGQSGRIAVPEYTNSQDRSQPQLIATVPKSGREEFRISLRDYNGVRKCELRVYARAPSGDWIATGKVVVIARAAIAAVIAALCECEARL
jgi:hypothetical protein